MKCWNIFMISVLITRQPEFECSNIDGKTRNGMWSTWGWHEEDLLISNWRRKCSSINNSVNAIKSFIAGGILAEMDKFPYLVGLVMLSPPSVYQCGGSLITERYIITAAHCLYRSIGGRVYLGSFVYASTDSAEIVYNVTRANFIINEGYDDRRGFQNDIALIRLPQSVTLSDKIKLISLAPRFLTTEKLQNEIVTAAGWGRLSDTSMEFNRQLYYVATPVISYEKCMCFFLPGLVTPRSHLCADGTGGRGGCDGDSGGPLVYNYENNAYLVGITSFGSAGGCEIGHPTVYTKVTNYLSWISKKTGLRV